MTAPAELKNKGLTGFCGNNDEDASNDFKDKNNKGHSKDTDPGKPIGDSFVVETKGETVQDCKECRIRFLEIVKSIKIICDSKLVT